MRERTSSKVKDQIVEDYRNGCSLTTAGRRNGTSRTTVRRILEERRVERRPPEPGNQKMTAEDRADASAAYATGASLAELAKRYRVNDRYLKRRLEADGAPKRDARYTPEAIRRAIVSDYVKGTSVGGVAATHKVARTTVRRVLRAAKVRLRGRAPAGETTEAASDKAEGTAGHGAKREAGGAAGERRRDATREGQEERHPRTENSVR